MHVTCLYCLVLWLHYASASRSLAMSNPSRSVLQIAFWWFHHACVRLWLDDAADSNFGNVKHIQGCLSAAILRLERYSWSMLACVYMHHSSNCFVLRWQAAIYAASCSVCCRQVASIDGRKLNELHSCTAHEELLLYQTDPAWVRCLIEPLLSDWITPVTYLSQMLDCNAAERLNHTCDLVRRTSRICRTGHCQRRTMKP